MAQTTFAVVTLGVLSNGITYGLFQQKNGGAVGSSMKLVIIWYELKSFTRTMYADLVYQAGAATRDNPVPKDLEKELLNADPHELTCEEIARYIALLKELIEWRLEDLNPEDERPNGYDSHEDWLELVVKPRLEYLEDHLELYCE